MNISASGAQALPFYGDLTIGRRHAKRARIGRSISKIDSMSTSSIRLVVRADDAGSFTSANEAIEGTIAAGLVRNVSLMVPGPAFEDAARRFAGRDDICYGLHVTLNAELTSLKWGPVSPRAAVPSLLDENGFFLPTPPQTMQAGFVVQEAMQEIEAQLRRARKAGFKISYVDEHMGVSYIGIREQIAALCRRESLIDAHAFARISLGTSLDTARAALCQAHSGQTHPDAYVWVTHPGFETPEMRALHPEGRPNDGSFARAREAERQLLLNPQLALLLKESGVQVSRYDEICAG